MLVEPWGSAELRLKITGVTHSYQLQVYMCSPNIQCLFINDSLCVVVDFPVNVRVHLLDKMSDIESV